MVEGNADATVTFDLNKFSSEGLSNPGFEIDELQRVLRPMASPENQDSVQRKMDFVVEEKKVAEEDDDEFRLATITKETNQIPFGSQLHHDRFYASSTDDHDVETANDEQFHSSNDDSCQKSGLVVVQDPIELFPNRFSNNSTGSNGNQVDTEKVIPSEVNESNEYCLADIEDRQKKRGKNVTELKASETNSVEAPGALGNAKRKGMDIIALALATDGPLMQCAAIAAETMSKKPESEIAQTSVDYNLKKREVKQEQNSNDATLKGRKLQQEHDLVITSIFNHLDSRKRVLSTTSTAAEPQQHQILSEVRQESFIDRQGFQDSFPSEQEMIKYQDYIGNETGSDIIDDSRSIDFGDSKSCVRIDSPSPLHDSSVYQTPTSTNQPGSNNLKYFVPIIPDAPQTVSNVISAPSSALHDKSPEQSMQYTEEPGSGNSKNSIPTIPDAPQTVSNEISAPTSALHDKSPEQSMQYTEELETPGQTKPDETKPDENSDDDFTNMMRPGAPSRASVVKSIREKFERRSGGNFDVDMEKFYMDQRARLITYQRKKKEALGLNRWIEGSEVTSGEIDHSPMTLSVASAREAYFDQCRRSFFVFAVHQKKGLLLRKVASDPASYHQYEVPGGVVYENDYTAAGK
jgi:hypothetical protein